MVNNYVQQKNVTDGIVDLGLRVIGLGTITNLGKLILGSRVSFDSRFESKLKN